ncbi:MAG: hypothetical protein H6779_03145 [Candidatus Nomurabacteria bacterium]|nr:MAG: hypothetical protein H6779_03145 [Candidatus Nomurabacteria bacterium]
MTKTLELISIPDSVDDLKKILNISGIDVFDNLVQPRFGSYPPLQILETFFGLIEEDAVCRKFKPLLVTVNSNQVSSKNDVDIFQEGAEEDLAFLSPGEALAFLLYLADTEDQFGNMLAVLNFEIITKENCRYTIHVESLHGSGLSIYDIKPRTNQETSCYSSGHFFILKKVS